MAGRRWETYDSLRSADEDEALEEAAGCMGLLQGGMHVCGGGEGGGVWCTYPSL